MLMFTRRTRIRPHGRDRVYRLAGMCDIRLHLAAEHSDVRPTDRTQGQ